MSSFVVERFGNIVVFVHGAKTPDDIEWARAMELYRRDAGDLRSLVYTAGATPTTKQRSELKATLAGRSAPMAVLTTSALARAAGAAIRWFNPNFRMFSPDEIEAAFDHIKAPAADRATIRNFIETAKARL
jgi:ferredoxin-NADP reductase